VDRAAASGARPPDLVGRGLSGRRQDHEGTRSAPAGDARVALGRDGGGGRSGDDDGDMDGEGGGGGSGDGGGGGGGVGGGSGGDYGAEVVGASLSVIWVHYGYYYPGVVRSFDVRSGTHHVVYDDGDEDNIVLRAADVIWGDGGGSGSGSGGGRGSGGGGSGSGGGGSGGSGGGGGRGGDGGNPGGGGEGGESQKPNSLEAPAVRQPTPEPPAAGRKTIVIPPRLPGEVGPRTGSLSTSSQRDKI